METNVTTLYRALRIIVGLGVIVWGLVTRNWLGAIGAVPLLTGLIGFCTAYTLLGIGKSCGK